MFKYRLVPRLDFRKKTPITSNNTGETRLHNFPFASLGDLKSHAQPHFVIANCAQKILGLKFGPEDLAKTISQATGVTLKTALKLLVKIQQVYFTWMSLTIPIGFGNSKRSAESIAGDGADGHDEGLQSSKKRRQTRSQTRSQNEQPDPQGSGSGSKHTGNQAQQDSDAFDDGLDSDENPGLVDDKEGAESSEESAALESCDESVEIEDVDMYMDAVNERVSNWCSRSEVQVDWEAPSSAENGLHASVARGLRRYRREKARAPPTMNSVIARRNLKKDESHLWTTEDWIAHKKLEADEKRKRKRARGFC